jgi:hypothetical protein
MNKKESYVMLAYFLLAAFMAGFVRLKFAYEYPAASLDKLMAGMAATPFQYRILSVQIIKYALQFSHLPVPLVLAIYETLITACAIFAISAYAKATGLSERTGSMTALAYLFIIPFFFVFQILGRAYYPYDSLAVFFSALALWAIAKRQVAVFLVVFLLGMLNHEAIVLLLPLALWQERSHLRDARFWWLAGVGVLIVIAVKVTLAAVYSGNPGAGILSLDQNVTIQGLPRSWESSKLYANLSLFGGVEGLLIVPSVFGYLWLPLLFCFKRIRHDLVRNSLLVCVVSVVVVLVAGNLNDPAAFCSLAPVILVAVVHWLLSEEQAQPENPAKV